jgi:hypothetical protein
MVGPLRGLPLLAPVYGRILERRARIIEEPAERHASGGHVALE